LSVCRAPIAIGENRLVVTASVGVAIADSSAVDPVALVHEADTAMYRAKSEGGDRVEYANDAVQGQTLIRHDVEMGLHRALTDEALHVEFDEVRAADGSAVAQLVRLGWLHPEHGLVDAPTLADAADAVGLVATLTDWVVDRALAQLAGWLATPSDTPRFVLVDVDYQALRDTGFAQRLVDHLVRHRCEPRSLCIALDGGHLTAHLEEVKPVLERLAEVGVRIARNGVGAAGSSLTYLRGLPIDMVILDDALTGDPNSPNELLRLVIDVAKGGNRVVIAPASKAPDHRAFLYGLGVDLLYDSTGP
jgi:EAL domain-containing protein (putative c-di-GMP-specific phosphodiesterase class I)